ncbi:cyclin-dependent kinase 12-like [Oppia nitens]|uniref:cyclin-dependent kinase 12-like n=1 Tax=Oppia nitens TaxID=1686743 RepID=UPI0023DCD733|nr:cyclin-dependent kinase 12-like [Oppia nitens]
MSGGRGRYHPYKSALIRSRGRSRSQAAKQQEPQPYLPPTQPQPRLPPASTYTPSANRQPQPFVAPVEPQIFRPVIPEKSDLNLIEQLPPQRPLRPWPTRQPQIQTPVSFPPFGAFNYGTPGHHDQPRPTTPTPLLPSEAPVEQQKEWWYPETFPSLPSIGPGNAGAPVEQPKEWWYPETFPSLPSFESGNAGAPVEPPKEWWYPETFPSLPSFGSNNSGPGNANIYGPPPQSPLPLTPQPHQSPQSPPTPSPSLTPPLPSFNFFGQKDKSTPFPVPPLPANPQQSYVAVPQVSPSQVSLPSFGSLSFGSYNSNVRTPSPPPLTTPPGLPSPVSQLGPQITLPSNFQLPFGPHDSTKSLVPSIQQPGQPVSPALVTPVPKSHVAVPQVPSPTPTTSASFGSLPSFGSLSFGSGLKTPVPQLQPSPVPVPPGPIVPSAAKQSQFYVPPTNIWSQPLLSPQQTLPQFLNIPGGSIYGPQASGLQRPPQPVTPFANVQQRYPTWLDVGTKFSIQIPANQPLTNDEIDMTKKEGIEFKRSLGTGGFGQVYECQLTKPINNRTTYPNQLLAVKIVSISNYLRVGNTPYQALKAMVYEYRLHEPLNHPNIVDTIDVFNITDPITQFPCIRQLIFMELCSGTLHQLVVQMILMTETHARQWFTQIIRGVEYLHGKGIAHMDIKCPNILYKGQFPGQAVFKLADYGLAAQHPEVLGNRGTIGYMAPELAPNATVRTFPCDIWSLGITLCETLSGIGLSRMVVDQFRLVTNQHDFLQFKQTTQIQVDTYAFVDMIMVQPPPGQPQQPSVPSPVIQQLNLTKKGQPRKHKMPSKPRQSKKSSKSQLPPPTPPSLPTLPSNDKSEDILQNEWWKKFSNPRNQQQMLPTMHFALKQYAIMF